MEPLLDGLEVGERQFEFDDAEVFERIGRARDVVVDERPEHEHDGVDLADVGEELVAETLALAGTLDEPADVDDLDRGVDDVLRLRHRGEPIEPVVGDLGDADVRILRGERVRGGERTTAGECVVERTLARVGEADQTETFHEASEASDGAPCRRPVWQDAQRSDATSPAWPRWYVTITASGIHGRRFTKFRQPRIVSEATNSAAPTTAHAVAGGRRGDRHRRDDRQVGDDRAPELRVVRSCADDDAAAGDRHEGRQRAERHRGRPPPPVGRGDESGGVGEMSAEERRQPEHEPPVVEQQYVAGERERERDDEPHAHRRIGRVERDRHADEGEQRERLAPELGRMVVRGGAPPVGDRGHHRDRREDPRCRRHGAFVMGGPVRSMGRR